jgi:hypothetical protein
MRQSRVPDGDLTGRRLRCYVCAAPPARRFVTVEQPARVGDLRSLATPPYPPAQSLPPWAGGLFGAEAPIGSPAYAARDARDITPSIVEPPPDPIPGRRATGSLGPAQRFVVRIPDRWNGRLVVAGTPAQRSEFACDRMFGDPLLAHGYAYASSNKGEGDGALLLEPGRRITIEGAEIPRLLLPDGRGVSFWFHAPGHRLERWRDDFVAITERAREIIAGACGREPEATYAVGLSNGGYQVRRAIESSDLYDGALTWNAALWTPKHNLLVLTEAIDAMEHGDPPRVEALGFPPDVRGLDGTTLYGKNLLAYWYITAWLHATHLDPTTSLAYGDVTGPEPAESWNGRIASWRTTPAVRERITGFANTGDIQCKLIDLASEYDQLIPPKLHFEPYADLIIAAGKGTLYRAALIAHAQHVDPWSEDLNYPQMQPGYPRVMAAFDELITWVEETG